MAGGRVESKIASKCKVKFTKLRLFAFIARSVKLGLHRRYALAYFVLFVLRKRRAHKYIVQHIYLREHKRFHNGAPVILAFHKAYAAVKPLKGVENTVCRARGVVYTFVYLAKTALDEGEGCLGLVRGVGKSALYARECLFESREHTALVGGGDYESAEEGKGGENLARVLAYYRKDGGKRVFVLCFEGVFGVLCGVTFRAAFRFGSFSFGLFILRSSSIASFVSFFFSSSV